ncbi:LysM peptidoglycan-binding domain-containing protein [Legionella maceachernii]|uniref:Membrane bound lytic murein transglycosylase D n=1 Tax=Legionella maceachernii TaxID=466 RepID=A0A0W0VWS4_9GAMM|nr:LysM peptidoglycan-binding domain-containing protein [Legionella maceachernii]KTD24442.1 membrane bound lytic murein transglycosylase D [Legionella maceachernii]SJZ66608.1 membrane-bound lytic murein transglycosylase D [Legionella maceachernii]SUP01983.1 Membrane-bound lytic murein transglycosylase D precursor [Legionella maceachernii]
MKFSSLAFISFFLLFCSLSIFPHALYSRPAPNVWDVLRSQFTLNHEVNQPDVQSQIQWLITHPSYLQKLAQAEPYIYHIVTEVKKRRLPGELALLPMIESAYDPFAYSGVGAAGLWQLMPGTGNDLGLKQDWWFDARRSIRSSTDGALNYLTHLCRYFNGNWLLAIAAYDSGEGTVSRAIKNSGQSSRHISFWSLPVPSETKAYVPRLLALAEVIKYPQKYRVTLPDIPHVPYFEEVNIGSQIDLNHAAKLAGISYRDLIKLNPGYNRWATAPYKPFKLLIPADKVVHFNRNLATVPVDKRVSWTRHQVHSGDTLGSIAQRYFTTVKLIRELNQLKSDKLKLGQSILIPSSKNAPVAAIPKTTPPVEIDKPPTTQTYKVIHIVQPGDTYQTLEKKYNVTSIDIQNWNQTNAASGLKIGSQLIIWKRVVQYGVYTVKTGDSLSSIAKRNNTSVQTLSQLNPNIDTSRLKPGQKLVLG